MNESLWLPAIVIGNVLATLYLWQVTTRGPKRKFLNKLLQGSPIVPNHERRERVRNGGATPGTQFLSDFERFGQALNDTLVIDTRWRVQELSKALAKGAGPDSLGRRYRLFFNQVPVGFVQVSNAVRYSAFNPDVQTDLEFGFARLLPFETVVQLVSSIASLTASGTHEEYQGATAALHRATLNELWQIEYDRDLDQRSSGGNLEVRFRGTALAYLQAVGARRATA